MNKFDLSYFTLEKVANEWCCTIQELIELGAGDILAIWYLPALLEAMRAADGGHLLKTGHRPASALGKLYEEILAGRSANNLKSKLVITKEEFHRFEQEHNFQIHTEDDYPRELQIAVEVWDKVFSRGLKPQSPPQSMYEMVDDALKPYNLKDRTKAGRIKRIVVDRNPTKKIEAPTTTNHPRNKHGHPHYAPLLEIAIMLWEHRKKFDKDTFVANEGKDIFTLLNTKPDGGRHSKVD